MKKALLVTLLASTLGFGAAEVHADDNDSGKRGGHSYSKHEGGKHASKHRGGRKGGEKMMKRMAKKLDLTEAQRAKLKEMQDKHQSRGEKHGGHRNAG